MLFRSDVKDLHAASQTYAPTTAAYGFYNNSPFIDVFNHQIRRSIQSGLNTEMPNYERSRSVCYSLDNDQYRSVSYHDVFSLFFLFGIGLFLAFLYCIIENINNCCIRHQTRKNNYLNYHKDSKGT